MVRFGMKRSVIPKICSFSTSSSLLGFSIAQNFHLIFLILSQGYVNKSSVCQVFIMFCISPKPYYFFFENKILLHFKAKERTSRENQQDNHVFIIGFPCLFPLLHSSALQCTLLKVSCVFYQAK